MAGCVCQTFFEIAFADLATALESCPALSAPGSLPIAVSTPATALISTDV